MVLVSRIGGLEAGDSFVTPLLGLARDDFSVPLTEFVDAAVDKPADAWHLDVLPSLAGPEQGEFTLAHIGEDDVAVSQIGVLV